MADSPGPVELTMLEAITTKIGKAIQARLAARYRFVLIVFDVTKPEGGIGMTSAPPDRARVATQSWLKQFKEV